MTDVTLPEEAYTTLAGMRIARLLNGLWQLSGSHGDIDTDAALDNMFDYHNSGFTTWDLADHYGPAEDLIGQFKTRLIGRKNADMWEAVKAFTKWVPRPGRMTREVVEGAVDVSRRRMQTDTLDMLQFHWWEYRDDRYLEALEHLNALRAEGKISHLGLTNFDAEHVQIIREHDIPVVSNQVQFSLVDMRPEVAMQPYCVDEGIGLLAYGTLAGGLLTDRYLGKPEPTRRDLTTASLRKYKNMIDMWGGWGLFQRLLQTLHDIGAKHGASIANVATRAILDQPAVAGVIIGARLGLSDRRADNARTFSFRLTDEDWELIRVVQARANDLYVRIGDCGDEYRR